MERARYIFPLLFLLLTACEDQVAAPSRMEEPFSIFGIINPRLETQSVLISPVEPLLFDYPDTIDASVRMTALESGETILWRDSVIVGERGEREHAFVADFRPDFGASYQIEVERSDGALTSAVAHIPELVQVASDDLGSQTVHVSITGSSFHLLSIDVLYSVRYYSVGMEIADLCQSPPRTYVVSHTGRESETHDGYRVAINLALDHDEVMRQDAGNIVIRWRPGLTGFALMQLQVRLLVAEKAWDPPGSTFDATALAQPDVMSNVSNGYGFVGGGYNHDAAFLPSRGAIDATWFFDFLPRSEGENVC